MIDMGVKCFFLEETVRVRRALRRHAPGPCPAMPGEYGYHNLSVLLDEIEPATEADKTTGDLWPHNDPRWPTSCACGYEFRDSDDWELVVRHLYSRSDNGQLTTLQEAQPGAMWYADWVLTESSNRFRGPDNHCLVVKLPNGRDWIIDGRCGNCTMPDDDLHKCWVRHGTVPIITVDKNGNTCAAGGGSVQSGDYHGFLRNGEFVD